MNPNFQFKAKLWIWSGAQAAWHFLTLPKDLSEDIKGFYEGPKRGFGSVRVNVNIGKSTWKTSIFPDKKRGYVLPVKALVRKAEKIKKGDEVMVKIELI